MSRSHSGTSFFTLFVVVVLAAASVNAVVIPVDEFVGVDSDGKCSLLEAIENAQEDAAIHRDCPAGARADRLVLTANHEYVLESPWPGTSSGTPILTDDLEIVGNGAVIHRSISGPEYRLFEIRGGSVELDGLTLSGGLSFGSMAGGGAVLVDNADLTIRNSTLVDNTAAGLFVFGGAIRVDAATVLIEDSVIEDNTAFSENAEMGGAGIAQFDGQLTIRRSALLDNKADLNCNPSAPDSVASTGGALRVEAVGSGGAQTFIEDSTVAGNIGRVGGAIHVVAIADTGVAGIQDVFVQVLRSTVVYNQAPSCGSLAGLGDGIHVQEANGGTGLVAFGNAILHGNGRPFMGDVIGIDCSANSPNASFFPLEGSVIDPTDQCPSFGFDALESDVTAVLDPVRNNTHYVPLANGPAVDLLEAAVNCPLTEPDQLGNPRAGGPGQGGDLCDAGAVEFQPSGSAFTLQVTVEGNGSGSVASTPAGISCGATCNADFADGTSVELGALPATGDSFSGWSGACSGSGSCTVAMDQAQSVAATFTETPTMFPLQVAFAGGSGAITSIPAGIDCPGTCSAGFPAGTDVDLLQVPAAGFAFDSWTGDCSGDEACRLTMDGARSVTANYVQENSLTVSVTGSGAVTSTPAGIDCPGNCSAGFLPSEKVVLTPQAVGAASFVQWGGDCSGDGVCVVAMEADRQVTATFESAGFELRVVLEGEGVGQVFEIPGPGEIDCPGSCSATYPDGTAVTLDFSAGPDSSFQGFGGECSGTACTVTLDRDRVVRGTFLSADQLFIDSFE